MFVMISLVAAALTLSFTPAFAAQEDGEAMVRMAHLAPDAPNVEVYVDDELIGALRDVPFRTVSPYLPLPAGTHNVKVFPTGGASVPIFEGDVDFLSEASYTLAGVGLVEDGTFAARIYEDDNSPPSEGNAKLRMIHAVPDVGAASVAARGGADLFVLPGFSNASNYSEVPAGIYNLEVSPAGTDEVALNMLGTPLSAGEVYSAFAVGLSENGTLQALLVEDTADGGGGQVDLLADTGGIPVVDLLLPGTVLLVSSVAVGLFALRQRGA